MKYAFNYIKCENDDSEDGLVDSIKNVIYSRNLNKQYINEQIRIHYSLVLLSVRN